MDNKMLTEVVSGEFESNGIIYVVEPITGKISKVIKKGSNSFSMLGKVVLEEENNTKLLVFTDVDSAFVIKNTKPICMSTRELNIEVLNELSELISEAEAVNVSLIEQPKVTMPSTIIVKKVSLDNVEFGAFVTGDSGVQIKSNLEELGIDIVETNSTSILDPQIITHKVAQAVMVEYADGTRNIIGIDSNGHLIYTSRIIERDLTIRIKNITSGEQVKVLKGNY